MNKTVRNILSVGLLLAGGVQAATVVWGPASVDWNTATNWSTGTLPGTMQADTAIINAGRTATVGSNVAVTTNAVDINVSNGNTPGQLNIAANIRFQHFRIATATTATGVVIQSNGTLTVTGNFYASDNAGITTSSYTIVGGSLAVSGSAGLGTYGSAAFNVIGTNASSISVGSLDLDLGATLKFVLSEKGGITPINSTGLFKINSASKLVIDASACTGTVQSVDLVKFSSLSGAFDTNMITLIGTGSATVSYDSNSMNFGTASSTNTPPVPYEAELATVLALGSLTNAPVLRADDISMNTTNVKPGELKAVYFDALNYTGSPTRVYAYIGIPAGASAEHPVPGVVLVHGGGGTAFKDWVAKWTNCGYAAISIAVEGQTDSTTPPTMNTGWHIHNMPGPVRVGIYGDSGLALTNQWMYHAVADTVLANSLLRSLPEVNANQVGVMGISWGGVIASTTIGIDDRFAFAIPTYGCGHLYDVGNQYGAALWDDELYKNVWDPMVRMSNATMPAMWFSWPQENNFSLDSQAATYFAASGQRMVTLIPNMGHGHSLAWNPPDSYAFADSIISNGSPWCMQQSLTLSNSTATVQFTSAKPFDQAKLIFTRGTGYTGNLTWETNSASLVSNGGGIWTVTATLPADTTGWFVNALNGTLVASSDYQENISLIPTPADQLEISHPVFTNRSTATVEVAFKAPTNVEISDIRLSNQSHPGAFTNLTAAPMVLTNVSPATTSIWIKFDNSIAGLTDGQNATATLTIVWDELDGTTDQIELPVRALAWGGSNAVYGTWALSNGLSGTNANSTADPDGDGANNLIEYALGGNPTNPASAGYAAKAGIIPAGGTNWFNYVYTRRRDAAASGLSYTVEAVTNLVAAGWSTNGVTETGAGIIDSSFEAVTNRMQAGEKGFVRLKIGITN